MCKKTRNLKKDTNPIFSPEKKYNDSQTRVIYKCDKMVMFFDQSLRAFPALKANLLARELWPPIFRVVAFCLAGFVEVWECCGCFEKSSYFAL